MPRHRRQSEQSQASPRQENPRQENPRQEHPRHEKPRPRRRWLFGLARARRAARVLAAAPALAATAVLVAGAGNADAAGNSGALAASARPGHAVGSATASCGTYCSNYFTEEFGRSFVLNDYRSEQSVGTRVLLYPPSNANKDDDWTIWPAGTVAQLASVGLISPALALHFSADDAFELQYAPYGVGSGMCAGVASAPGVTGERVTLRWCGRSARTIWIADATASSGGYGPLISGADTDFSDPQVLTEPVYPGRRPRPGLVTERLQEFADGTVYDSQMWDNSRGVVP